MARLSDFLNQKIPSDFRTSDKQRVGIGAFTADVRIDESVKMETRAPTTILEDGSFVNDHIVNAPITVSISGEVSDIKVETDDLTQNFLRANAEIGVINKYVPALTDSQLNRVQTVVNNVRDAVDRIDDIVGDSEQIYNLFGNKDITKGATQKFFDYVEKLRLAKVPISIQMPYKLYDNMVITSLTIRNDNQYEPLAYSLTAQQIRFAQVEFIGIEALKQNPAPGTGGQTDGSVNKGVNDGEEYQEGSLAFEALNALGIEI